MTAQVLPLRRPLRLECSRCGAGADAACDCGAPYIPAGDAAAKAVAANPEKSNRAIAAEIGVDEGTVRKARKSTAENSAVEKRIGLDGKARRMPQPQQETPVGESRFDEDFVSPSDADKGLVLIAQRLDSGLFRPSYGILCCLKRAMDRADLNTRGAILEAAATLAELVRYDK